MDINLDIDETNNSSGMKNKPEENNDSKLMQPKPNLESISNLDIQSIARIFSKLSSDKRRIIIPIGFPQAGKSLFISSLIHYAITGTRSLFSVVIEENNYFKSGRQRADDMNHLFESGKIIGANKSNTLDLIGLTIKPKNQKLKSLDIALLDLAGEDIKKIKSSEGAKFTENINAIFNGLNVDNTPVIFTLITPWQPPILDNETLSDAHNREDTLHFDFLNYLQTKQKAIFENAEFFLIVSQWDLNPNQEEDVEVYIEKNRPATYNTLKSMSVEWGHYSIGKILESKIDNITVQEIIRKNYEYPNRLWDRIYYKCTKTKLNSKTWFEKILSIFE